MRIAAIDDDYFHQIMIPFINEIKIAGNFFPFKVTTQQNFIDLENGQVRLMLELTHDGGFVNLELERKNKV